MTLSTSTKGEAAHRGVAVHTLAAWSATEQRKGIVDCRGHAQGDLVRGDRPARSISERIQIARTDDCTIRGDGCDTVDGLVLIV